MHAFPGVHGSSITQRRDRAEFNFQKEELSPFHKYFMSTPGQVSVWYPLKEEHCVRVHGQFRLDNLSDNRH